MIIKFMTVKNFKYVFGISQNKLTTPKWMIVVDYHTRSGQPYHFFYNISEKEGLKYSLVV